MDQTNRDDGQVSLLLVILNMPHRVGDQTFWRLGAGGVPFRISAILGGLFEYEIRLKTRESPALYARLKEQAKPRATRLLERFSSGKNGGDPGSRCSAATAPRGAFVWYKASSTRMFHMEDVIYAQLRHGLHRNG